MNRLLTASAVLLIAAGASIGMAEELKSGLEPGAHAGVFHVRDVTGPNASKSICYR